MVGLFLRSLQIGTSGEAGKVLETFFRLPEFFLFGKTFRDEDILLRADARDGLYLSVDW